MSLHESRHERRVRAGNDGGVEWPKESLQDALVLVLVLAVETRVVP